MIPLILRLKKTSHREIAKAQDVLVDTMNSVFDIVVLHGGTAIWRCYSGTRFSEDIDVYIKRDVERIGHFFKSLERKGCHVVKKKIGENSVYSTLNVSGALVRFEAVFKKVDGILKEYEKVEGNLITVYTLSAEELIVEKVDAYLNRRKIRDLYDIFFLLRYSKEGITSQLKKLIDYFVEPIDEKDLKLLILEGIVPTKDKMMQYIKDRVKHG